MSSARLSILLAALGGMLASLSGTPVAAQRDVDFVSGWNGGYYSRYADGDSIAGQETWIAYYVGHAQVRKGPERKLATGVRWRLVTDQRTGIAMPRIVWMSESRMRATADRMLEMVHGAAMLFSRQQQEAFLAYLRDNEENVPRFSGKSEEDHKRHFRNVRELMPKRIVTQTDVALTYASSGFVSLIDLGFIYRDEGTYLPRIIRGVTIDLERRRIFTMEACPEGSLKGSRDQSTALFRFADLLEICDLDSLKRFNAVAEAANDRIRAATADSKDPLIKGCQGTGIGDGHEVVVYLAVGGLAVHLTQFWPDAATRSCPLTLTARNPLIVPYRDLEPLMKPGSLREELLKSK